MRKALWIALLLPALCWAEINPTQGALDPRVRTVDYSPRDVVKITAFYGVSTHIQFADDEKITDVAVGDDQAWKVIDRRNHLFVKPVATNANTNVTVVTTKRAYQFAFVVQTRSSKDASAWSDPGLIFSLNFRYPDDDRARAEQQARAAAVATRQAGIKDKLTAASQASENQDYWVMGSDLLSPTAARDDGRFIYLTFKGNRDMPAVYALNDAGEEALINTNVIDGNTIVVQRMVPRLMLRKGSDVAMVQNKSFDINGGRDNTSGTVSPEVVRVLKGGQ